MTFFFSRNPLRADFAQWRHLQAAGLDRARSKRDLPATEEQHKQTRVSSSTRSPHGASNKIGLFICLYTTSTKVVGYGMGKPSLVDLCFNTEQTYRAQSCTPATPGPIQTVSASPREAVSGTCPPAPATLQEGPWC